MPLRNKSLVEIFIRTYFSREIPQGPSVSLAALDSPIRGTLHAPLPKAHLVPHDACFLTRHAQQCVGRLHRIHEGKKVVQVYDYVDSAVPMLARMFEKRLRGYEAIGYGMENAATGGPNLPADDGF